MFRITRIRLAGVGPADARFDKPSPDAAPFEVSCADANGDPSDSVVWLENGGGKTVFLSLLFHVLRPDRAAQIGNDERGGRRADISDFVLAGDVAHVVCEWVAADSDERLLTGLVAERRGGHVNRTWYLVAIRDNALDLDDLRFDVEGRRVPAARYIESLEQHAARSGKVGRRNRVEVKKTSVQRTWFETLADHDLDPALFEYQVRMNRSEGGATSLFRFTSAERFVEFFLQLTMNADTVVAVSNELTRVAEKVASLPRKELELAHAAGAADRLASLNQTWTGFQDSDRAALAARADAETLHDQLHAAVRDAATLLSEAEERILDLDAERARRDKTRREADTRAKLAAIALGDARVASLKHAVEQEETANDDAALTAAAWPRVAQHQRRVALEHEIIELRRALDDADRAAAPLRERADVLLRSLRRELTTQRAAAEGELAGADDDRRVAEQGRNEAARRLRDAEGRIREIAGLLTGLERDISRHARAVDRAVADGHVTRGADITEALNASRAEEKRIRGVVEETSAGRRAMAAELPDLRDAARKAAEEASVAEHARAQQQATVDAAVQERQALAAHPLLAVLGAEDADLEYVGADLVGRVSAEADRRRGEAIAAEAAAADDRRAVDHLERDRLLPARAEVDALCRDLHEAGVTSAVAGWRYLVDAVPADAHAAVVAAHPAVLDGIVVAAADLDRARAALADAAPAAAVLVARGATLTDPSAEPVGWVVPPASAMHDRGAAESELERRRGRLDVAADASALLADEEKVARALSDHIEAHLTAWPPGTLPAAGLLVVELTTRARDASLASDDAGGAVTAAEELLAEADRNLDHGRHQLSAAERRSTALADLAGSAERAGEAETEAAQLRAESDTRANEARAANDEVGEAESRVESARRRRETAERAVEGASRQLAELPDPGAGPTDERIDIAGLRAAYDSALALVAAQTTDSELARELRSRESDRAGAESEWTALPLPLRTRVEELGTTPAAADLTARRKAEESAAADAAAAAKRLAAARTRLGVTEAERAALPDPEPTWPVEPFDMPTDEAELATLAAELADAFESARQSAAAIREDLAAAAANRDQLKLGHSALVVQADALGNLVGDRARRDATAFVGDAAEAVGSAMRHIAETAAALRAADEAWRAAAHAVGVFARGDRWSELKGELTRRLRDDAPEALAPSSGELLTQTRLLESRLRDDIERLDTHRQMLVTSLGDAVTEAARSLRSARTKSELPSGLGDWSHQPFLKIGLDLTRDRAERDGRLRRFTNDLLELAAAKATLPTGADLICQAVLACAERAVTVELLKPNKAQRLRYVPITETPTLSGGMRATAAIAMFCTLAKVRAANRTGRVGVGTLVLDNPLGDANATYLVALQRLVAQMSDVQLIYTTGVNDMDALRLFPVVTRLTNEVGKRSHLAYVVADEAFLKRLAPGDGDSAVITGTRLVRRTPPILTTDLALMPGDDE